MFPLFCYFSFFLLTRITRESPSENFTRYLDASKGATVDGISDLKKYFRRFGYLSPADENLTDAFDESFEAAVFKYQMLLSLPVTGNLDATTISSITSPRCGVQDVLRFSFFSGQPRWTLRSPMRLTYAVSPEHVVDYLRTSELRSALRRSFWHWSSVIPVTFSESLEYNKAHIKIGFYSGEHGDGEPFDGVLGVVAHAFSPENGRIHFDVAERWTVGLGSGLVGVRMDLESVATHEIGHVLGLAHSSVKDAVMYPNLKPGIRKVRLNIDDIIGIQALYGLNPKFNMSAFAESATSSGFNSVPARRLFNWAAALLWVIVLTESLSFWLCSLSYRPSKT